jgi:hypothetical protein
MTDPITCRPEEVVKALNVLNSKYAYLEFPLKDHIPISGLRRLKSYLDQFTDSAIVEMYAMRAERLIWASYIDPIRLPATLDYQFSLTGVSAFRSAYNLLVKWCDDGYTIKDYHDRMFGHSMFLDVSEILRRVKWEHQDRYDDALRQSKSDWPTV